MPTKLFGNLLQLDDTTNELQILKGFLAQAASRIVGSADAVQLIIKGNATQTSNIRETQTSASAVLWAENNAGDLTGLKAGFTAEGGLFVNVVAGENLSRGEVVYSQQGAGGADGKVYKNPVDGDMPLGIVYADAVSNAAVKVVVSGIAYVLPQAAITATRGYVLYSSATTAGRADQAASVPAALQHFREIGHWIDTGSGNGVLTRAIIHFN